MRASRWYALASILSLLLAGALLFTEKTCTHTRHDDAYSEMGEITKALNQYSLQHDGQYPEALESLEDNHFPNGVPSDPFTKEPYVYVTDGRGFSLVCYGKDGKSGGRETIDQDIVYSEAGCLTRRR
jgi:hypothetical protein